MRIANVIGTVTLGRSLDQFKGASLKLVTALNLEHLTEATTPTSGEVVVVWDELGAGNGSQIALSEGPEAAQPFRPEVKPVDAYNAAILDQVDLREMGPRKL